MLLLIRSELRDMRRNLLNSTLVSISLCIGVMSVLVTHELSVSILNRFDRQGMLGSYDHVIYLTHRTEAEYFELRARWRAGEWPEISHMVPVIEGSLTAAGVLYNVLGYDVIATLPSDVARLEALQSDMRFLTEDSVFALGDRLQTGDRIHDALVLNKTPAPQRQLIADLPTAQRMLGREGAIDAIWLRSAKNDMPWWELAVPGLLTAARTESPPVEFDGYRVLPFSWWNPSKQLGDAIVFNLGMLSLLTLVVAGFIVLQATQSNLRNRHAQIALLNSIGLSAAEQRCLVFLHCGVVGTVGCTLGVLTGVSALAYFNDMSVITAWRTLSAFALWKALALGSMATLIVAAGTNPRAMQRSPAVWWIATGLAIAGLLYGFNKHSGLLGASLLSVCFCLLNIFCVVPLATKGAIAVLSRLRTASFTARMNLRNAIVTVNDIRLAINALSIAIATAIGIGLMLVSFRTEFEAILKQRLVHDLHLSDAAHFDPEAFAARADVDAVRAYYRGLAHIDDVPTELVATVLDSHERARYGYEGSRTNGIFINEVAARKHGFQVGDRIHLDIALDQERTLPVLHIFKDYGASSSRAIAPLELVELDQLIADRFSIDTPDPERMRQSIASMYPGIRVVDSNAIRRLALQTFDASFAAAQIMVNVAIFVAVIGMACALIGLQARRLREMRTLTMLGMSRWDLALNAVIQNGLLGLFAVLSALPLSFALAWNLCYNVNPRAYGWSFDLDFSWQAVLVPTLLGIVAAILAGLEPLRRALAKIVSQPFSHAS